MPQQQLTSIEFAAAFYIKLGRAGVWEADSIEAGKLRLGWRYQSIADINTGNWDKIERELREQNFDKPIGVTTTDLNALKIIANSGSDDVWVTFHKSKLWWTRLAPGPVEEDDVSKFRLTDQPWSDHSSDGRLLVVNDLPGKISQLQGFRGTVCRVKYLELLKRTLNGTRST